MKLNDSYSHFRGAVRVFRKDADGGLHPVIKKSNVITFQAADILAQIMSGNAAYRPSHIGFLYGPNTASMSDPSTKSPPRDHVMQDIADDLEAIGGNMIVSPLTNYASVDIDGDASRYEGNRVTVNAISDQSATPVYTGGGFGSSSPTTLDNYFQVALLTQFFSPGSSIPEYKLFARTALNSTSGLPVQSGFELAVFWDISFF